MGIKKVLTILLILAAAVATALLYGAYRWNAGTRALRAQLEGARAPIHPTTVDFRLLDGLPAPVQRYLRTVLEDGMRMIAAVDIEHSGTFNMNESGEKWRPFTSNQRVIIRRPGFDWEGRISMMPGLKACVHDAYIAGDGILHASLFGLFSIVRMRGTSELAEGELMRFVAETAWYPTALLPGQGVQWAAVDDSSAQATLKDGETTVTLLFRFDAGGLIESVRAEARGRAVAGETIPTPWEGRWRNYERRSGMLVPLDGEVAWILPEGPKPYWRGHITKIDFEFTE